MESEIAPELSPRKGCALAIVLLLAIAVTQSAQAQTFNVIYTFTGGLDGASPQAGLTIDRGGNLYGLTNAGGIGYGTAFKLAHQNSSWLFNNLYSFAGGNDGAGSSHGRVTFGPNGTLYGTTTGGGGGPSCTVYEYTGCGTVFNLKPPPHSVCETTLCPWTETVLYRFTGSSDGAHPAGDITFDQSGTIYGAAYQGGNCCGVIYSLTPSNGGWNQSVVYPFTGGNDGSSPHGFEIFDNAGNLYGTNLAGGTYGYGVVFKLTPSGSGWTENTLHAFQFASEGGAPVAGVIFDSTGNLYGATIQYGPANGGTVFELTPSGGFSVLYSFFYSGFGGDDCGPQASLVMDRGGNLYGTTLCDGTNQQGSVFKLTPSEGGWTYSDLYNFTGGSDGGIVRGGVTLDANGNLYGTASEGGNRSDCNGIGCGVVWEITP